MSNNLLDLSAKIDHSMVEVFEAVATVTAAKGIRYFVVGATARDMILSYGYGIESRRATVDVDLGVEVADWAEFHTLKNGLIATGQFKPSRSMHRLVYNDSLPIDIVPFGPLENMNKEISWPPDHSIRMNVMGFEDAYRGAQRVRLRSEPALDIPFATPAGLAVMKVIAWNDRSPHGGKDAGDLAFLIRTYLDAGNQDRLANELPDLLDEDDFDYERASARLLGRDMARILSPATKSVILDILDRETKEQSQYRLVGDMMKGDAVGGDTFETYLMLLQALKGGIQEG